MGRNYHEDERVISAFLNHYKITDIMKSTGRSRNTVYRIRNDPRFQKALQDRKDAIIKTAVSRMQSCLLKDIDVLQEIILNPDISPQIRINAIQIKLNQLNSWVTTSDIVSRIERLEEPEGDELAENRTFEGGLDENTES